MNTPDLILTHALELFSTRGYDAVGVQELVLAAGVTKPTLYHHFGNKEGVLGALIARDSQPLLTKLEAASHYHGDLTQNLLAVVETYLTFAATRASFYRLLSTCSLAPPESRSYGSAYPVEQQQRGLVEALFENASRDHGNMRGRARPLRDRLSRSHQRLLAARPHGRSDSGRRAQIRPRKTVQLRYLLLKTDLSRTTDFSAHHYTERYIKETK